MKKVLGTLKSRTVLEKSQQYLLAAYKAMQKFLLLVIDDYEVYHNRHEHCFILYEHHNTSYVGIGISRC